ncbi:MAG TPA: hypothetical protein PLH94_13800 [Fimbriimonadaceae bacterium]|nr:hypothetical protein [Fimbriimonadaceae bacterium]
MQIFRSGLAILGALLGISSATAQELVQNPDFANNSFGSTQFNLSNTAFTDNVAFCRAFGAAGETDLVYGADFGPAPPVGNTKVGLHTQINGNNDRLGLTLLNPVSAGAKVRLRFWSVNLVPTDLLIGIANVPNSFGTQMTRVTVPGTWGFTDVVVTAPQAGQYLTFMTDPSILDGYAFVTGLSFVPTLNIRPVSASARAREIRTGERSTITVNLNANAPTGGTPVFVSYSAAALIGPGVVIVPAGRRSVTFTVLGNNLAATTRRVDITLSNNFGSARTYVLVRPAR